MNLYFLRHASAGNRRANPLIDRKRPIDKEGVGQCRLIAQLMNALDLQLDVILSSPLKRALQTASMIAMETGHDMPVVIAKELAPGGAVADFRNMLASHGGQENILVVGHNPNLAEFLSALIGGGSEHTAVRLRKGSLARVDMTQRPGVLQWVVDPRLLGKAFASAQKAKNPRRKRRAAPGKVKKV